jgi:CubicO group peptidase (beta-lactamase class C family)
MTTEHDLAAELTERATRLGVPGVAIGVHHDGTDHYAFHGVTSVENPLPVDASTLFQFGSTGKTYTATAILRLVDQGKVDLDAPVRTYVPELKLKDESVAEKVTVLQLLNHTAGWAGDFEKDTGTGDDALARYVEAMAGVEQITPLGAEVSYNNASLSLAGRIIEKVTGLTYERAIGELLLTPLGMDSTYFFPNDVMTRRFAVGHTNNAEGMVKVARPWALPRNGNAAGGMSATVGDQITWAKFHLADGRTADGTQLLPAELVRSMREPTVETPGHALGDAIGITWMLRQVADVLVVGHGGTTIGQHSAFSMVPERNFAVTVLTNCGPSGEQLNTELVDWAMQAYLGVVDAEPDILDAPADLLEQYAGHYDDTVAMTVDISGRAGRLAAKITIRPELLAEVGDLDHYDEPIILGLIDGSDDRYYVGDGAMKGLRGFFSRGADGHVEAISLGGRRFARTATG